MEENRDFVPYEEAIELKELGFNEPCLIVYRGGSLYASGSIKRYYEDGDWDFETNSNYGGDTNQWVAAPLYQQAFRFFREKCELKHSIQDFIDDKLGIEWDYMIAIIGTDADENGNYNPLVDYTIDDETRKFKTHEEAELACLRKIIQIAKGQ